MSFHNEEFKRNLIKKKLNTPQLFTRQMLFYSDWSTLSSEFSLES